MKLKKLSLASPLDQSVETDGEYVIKGASVITKGEALGHNVWVDDSFLDAVVEQGNSIEGGLKMAWGHRDMLTTTAPDRFVGKAFNFRRDGDRVRCDIQLSAAAKLNPRGNVVDYLMALAKENPDAFGLSIVFDYEEVGVLDNGMMGIKLVSLHGVDFVDEPAANPDGLFNRQQQAKPKEADMPEERKSFQLWREAFGMEFAAEHYDKMEFAQAKLAYADHAIKKAELACGEKDKKLEEMAAELDALKAKLASIIDGQQDPPKQDPSMPCEDPNAKNPAAKYSAKVEEFAKSMPRHEAFRKAAVEFPELHKEWKKSLTY